MSVPFQQEASRHPDRLQRVLDAAKLVNSTLDLHQLTQTILVILRNELEVDRGTVFVVDREKAQLRSFVAQGVEQFEITLPIGAGIAGAVAANGEVIDIPDAYQDPRFSPEFDAILGYRTRDVLALPIRNRDRDVIGVLQLLNRTHGLDEEDWYFLEGISDHIGIALENAWLHHQIVEKKKIEQQLSLAREIQGNFIPDLPKVYGGVQISASSDMCYAIGGDYMDFVPLGEERFIFVVGDVSGKGIGAALLMTSLHATCRTLLRHIHSIEHVMRSLNDMLVEITRGRSFVTFVMLLIDPRFKRLHYVCAGHEPPMIVSPEGAVAFLSEGGGMPLGLFAGQAYTRGILDIREGSVITVYTDGVTEARNMEDAEFGSARVADIVRSRLNESAESIHSSIRAALKAHVGDAPTHDDSTLVVLKV